MSGRKNFQLGVGVGLSIGALILVVLALFAVLDNGGGSGGGGGSDEASATTVTGTAPPPTLPGPPDDASDTLITIGSADPGDIVGLRAAGGTIVEWIDRPNGQILSLDVTDPALELDVIADVAVARIGREWGLIDSIVLDDGRRFASWTQPGSGDFDNGNLVVGEIVDGVASRIVWNAGRVPTAGFGGTLDELDGRIVLSLGDGVGWADTNATRGALVSLDPDGDPDQVPIVVSAGYVEPRAFLVLGDELWVWDRAADRDPADRSANDVERFGRADLADRDGLVRSADEPRRSPTSMIELPDGRLGVCGAIDDQLRAYSIEDSSAGTRTTLGASDPVMPCSTDVAVLADGSIVTAATLDDTVTLQLHR